MLGGRHHEGSHRKREAVWLKGREMGAEQASVNWRGMKRLMGGLWVPLEDWEFVRRSVQISMETNARN